VTNPESGTLTHTYDDNGNVATKVTPTQNQTSSSNTTTLNYCYDSVNRLTAKWYAPQTSCTSPTVSYTYSGTSCLGQASCYNVGRRTGMTDQAGSESWAYDTIGRVEAQSRTTNGVTKTTSYTYNLDSSIAAMTYPSGRVVTYTPDTAGRPTALKDNTSSVYYVTGSCPNGVSGNGTCYAPQGALSLIQNGSALYTTHIYNDRLQPCWMYSTTGTALATSHLCTDTATAGNMLDLKYNFNLGADNGNPISVTNNRVTDRSQSFTYDQLNRISTAQTTATHSSDPTDCWGQAFGFDTWGNLMSISGASSSYTGCTQGSLSVSVTASNQISGDTYDAAGNLMTVPGTGGATYVYNAQNQMTSTSNSSTQYVYDGDGNRVEKTGSKIYWYAGGEILDETDTTGSTTNSSFNEYYFFGANRIARRDSSSNVFYYLADHLDSSRVIAEVPSGQTTATLCYDADFEPYGGEHTYTNTCPQNYKFTSKERDTESGLDNFGARFYASTTGRFMSPDWALRPTAVPYAKFGDPQTLNLYTYVENSPLNRIDADGHEDKRLNLGDGVSTQGPETGPSTCNGGNNNCPAAQSNVTVGYAVGQTLMTAASKTSSVNITDKDGNVLGTTTTTTTALFQAGGANAGQYLRTETNTTTVPTLLGLGTVQSGSTTTVSQDLKGAVATLGAGVMQAQRMGASFCSGRCATASRFPAAVAADVRAHPFAYALHAAGLALPFLEVPTEIHGLITAGEALKEASDLQKEMGNQ